MSEPSDEEEMTGSDPADEDARELGPLAVDPDAGIILDIQFRAAA